MLAVARAGGVDFRGLSTNECWPWSLLCSSSKGGCTLAQFGKFTSFPFFAPPFSKSSLLAVALGLCGQLRAHCCAAAGLCRSEEVGDCWSILGPSNLSNNSPTEY